MLRPLLLAASFLTRAPLPQPKEYRPADFGHSFAFYPLIGVLIGGSAAATAHAIIAAGASPLAAAFAALLVPVLLTGALHLDGLADSADGLFCGKGPERSLAVMKEPATGPFGVTAICLAMIGKFAALWILCGEGRFAAIAAALAFSRWAMVAAGYRARYPRAEGTGAAFTGQYGAGVVAASTLLAAALGWWLDAAHLAPMFLMALAAALTVRWLAARKIGGMTGDVFGAVNETAETLLLFAA